MLWLFNWWKYIGSQTWICSALKMYYKSLLTILLAMHASRQFWPAWDMTVTKNLGLGQTVRSIVEGMTTTEHRTNWDDDSKIHTQ